MINDQKKLFFPLLASTDNPGEGGIWFSKVCEERGEWELPFQVLASD
jgi:hypothetical protein